MRKVLREKTSVEKGDADYILISVKDAGRNEVWHCDRCDVLFEQDDMILQGPRSRFYCAREVEVKKASFMRPDKVTKKTCKTWILGGTVEYFEKNYIIDSM